MIQFNKLQINREGTKLTIDIAVKDLEYYNNVYIDSISIDTQDTFVNSGPSGKPKYTKILEGNNKTYVEELSNITIPLDGIIFIWVRTKGNPSNTTPCGEDKDLILGVTVNMYPIYKQLLNYTKEFGNTCIKPKGFIDLYLKTKIFDLSIKTGHYTDTIKYWNKFFKNINTEITSNTCGCNG